MARFAATFLLIAVLSLFWTASQHHHDTDAEDQDCAICSAVVHHVADIAVTPTVPPPVTSVMYYVASLPQVGADSVLRTVCPPICGPPLSL